MTDTYVRVPVVLQKRTAKAVLVSLESDPDVEAWIPRSCIHGADESQIDEALLNAELTLRIWAWKAKEEGLI